MSTQIRKVAIVGGNRIPFVKSNAQYSDASNLDMLTASIQGLVDRYSLHGERLGEVAAGAVIKHSRDFNLTREAVLSTTLAPETPAFDVQQACGTGLEAAILIGNKIALGQIDAGIACGVEAMSDPPVVFPQSFRELLLESHRGRSFGQRFKPWTRLRPWRDLKPILPGVVEPRTGLSMGQSCELMVRTWGVTRAEQDQLALESHKRAAAAWREGFYDDLVVPHADLKNDNNVRGDSSLEKLATLRPVFDTRGGGTLTAGNSTPITDGAATLLLASEDWAAQRKLPVLAWLRAGKSWAVDFASGKEGLLMAPAYAASAMLATQKTLEALRTEVGELRDNIRATESDKEKQFQELVVVKDELFQAQGEKERLEAKSTQLLEQISKLKLVLERKDIDENEPVDGDDGALGAHPAVPAQRDTRLHADPERLLRWQHRIPILLRLRPEALPAGQRHDARADARAVQHELLPADRHLVVELELAAVARELGSLKEGLHLGKAGFVVAFDRRGEG